MACSGRLRPFMPCAPGDSINYHPRQTQLPRCSRYCSALGLSSVCSSSSSRTMDLNASPPDRGHVVSVRTVICRFSNCIISWTAIHFPFDFANSSFNALLKSSVSSSSSQLSSHRCVVPPGIVASSCDQSVRKCCQRDARGSWFPH